MKVDRVLYGVYRKNPEGFTAMLETARHESSIFREDLKTQLRSLDRDYVNDSRNTFETAGFLLGYVGVLILGGVGCEISGHDGLALFSGMFGFPVGLVYGSRAKSIVNRRHFPIENYDSLRQRAIEDGRIKPS